MAKNQKTESYHSHKPSKVQKTKGSLRTGQALNPYVDYGVDIDEDRDDEIQDEENARNETEDPHGNIQPWQKVMEELAAHEHDWLLSSEQDQATEAEPTRQPKRHQAKASGHAETSGQSEDSRERLLFIDDKRAEKVSKKLTQVLRWRKHCLMFDDKGYAFVHNVLSSTKFRCTIGEVYFVAETSKRRNGEFRFETKVRNKKLMIRLTDRSR